MSETALKQQIQNLKKHNARLVRIARDARNKLSAALDGTGLCLWQLDVPSGKLIIFNRRWGSMLGYQPKALSAHFDVWREHLHEDDRQRVLDAFYRIMQRVARDIGIGHRGDPGVKPRVPVLGIAGAGSRRGDIREMLGIALAQRLEHGRAILEIVVEGAFRDTGAIDDVVDAGGGHAFLYEERGGGVEDFGAAAIALAGTRRRAGKPAGDGFVQRQGRHGFVLYMFGWCVATVFRLIVDFSD